MHVQHSISCNLKAFNVRPLTRCVPFRSWCSSWLIDIDYREAEEDFKVAVLFSYTSTIFEIHFRREHEHLSSISGIFLLRRFWSLYLGSCDFLGQLDLRRYDMNTMLGSTFERLSSDFRSQFYADEYICQEKFFINIMLIRFGLFSGLAM